MKLLTTKQAARVLQVPQPRVYEMAREGLLPSGVVVRLGRQVRLNEERLRQSGLRREATRAAVSELRPRRRDVGIQGRKRSDPKGHRRTA